jgi:phosphoglucosamine mutase
MEQLHKNNWLLGGESSGHIVCRHLTTTGDGTVAALQVLKAMVESGKSLKELRTGMSKMPQTMINVRMEKKVDISGVEEIDHAVASTEEQLGSRGRVLLRPSGTEPVVRVMIEGEDESEVEALCKELAVDVEKALNSLETSVQAS